MMHKHQFTPQFQTGIFSSLLRKGSEQPGRQNYWRLITPETCCGIAGWETAAWKHLLVHSKQKEPELAQTLAPHSPTSWIFQQLTLYLTYCGLSAPSRGELLIITANKTAIGRHRLIPRSHTEDIYWSLASVCDPTCYRWHLVCIVHPNRVGVRLLQSATMQRVWLLSETKGRSEELYKSLL